jgi:hypothetical protein
MTITTTNSPRLKVHFCSLVMNFKSIAGNIEGLRELQQLVKCNFVTNQELIVTHEMLAPSDYLESIIVEYLLPRGFKWSDDFIILNEPILFGVGDKVASFMNQGFPELENIEWLESLITENGSFVWCRDSELAKKETDQYWIEQLHKIQEDRGDYFKGRAIKIVADKGEKLQIHQEGVKNGALFVTKEFIRNYFNTEI